MSSAGQTPATAAQTSRAPAGGEHAVDLFLLGQVGAHDAGGTDLGGELLRTLLATVVVHDHLGPLRRKGTRARGADPA